MIETCPCQTDMKKVKYFTEKLLDLQNIFLGFGTVGYLDCMCLASGERVFDDLLSSLLHDIETLLTLDSGIDTADDEDDDDIKDSLQCFSLCDSCTSIIPRVKNIK